MWVANAPSVAGLMVFPRFSECGASISVWVRIVGWSVVSALETRRALAPRGTSSSGMR